MKMEPVEKYLTLNRGLASGDSLRCKHWPVERPRAVVLVSHGFAEHIERYEHLSGALNRAGYAVLAIDHWGHGKSDGVPGYVPAFSVFLDGLDALVDEAKATHPDKKRYLIGHSMGGLIASLYLIERQHGFTGAILSGPSIKPVEEPPGFVLSIGRFLSIVAPKVGLIGLDSSLVSSDPRVVAEYVGDPFVYKGKIRARLGAEMIDAMMKVESEAANITIPIMIMHGGADGLASPEGSRILFQEVASADKQLKIYEGFYHEIFNEPRQGEVINDVIQWLDARI